VIKFEHNDTDNTEYEPFGDIVKSMCLGMNNRNVTNNQDILTYSGKRTHATKNGTAKRSVTAVVQVSVEDYP
jgi:hypothetical protein